MQNMQFLSVLHEHWTWEVLESTWEKKLTTNKWIAPVPWQGKKTSNFFVTYWIFHFKNAKTKMKREGFYGVRCANTVCGRADLFAVFYNASVVKQFDSVICKTLVHSEMLQRLENGNAFHAALVKRYLWQRSDAPHHPNPPLIFIRFESDFTRLLSDYYQLTDSSRHLEIPVSFNFGDENVQCMAERHGSTRCVCWKRSRHWLIQIDFLNSHS